MERESRGDLLKTLEAQKEKIHRYETKLKDLVAAYKSQLRENETLQATIKSLQTAAASKKKDESGTEEQGDDDSSTLQQIEDLTKSMTDLMEEKKNLQTAAVNERKALKSEYEEKIEKVQSAMEKHRLETEETGQIAAELRKKLRSEQMDREREQRDHAAILREQNKNLHAYMTEKEDLAHQLEDLRKEYMISKQQPDANEQYEVMIADLTNQVDALRRKLKSNENEANQRVVLGDLKKEIAEIKASNSKTLEKEQNRANTAESKLMELSHNSEFRISELESKVSQLSEMVGNYERLRFSDQQSIHKLKDRVTQLDLENTALARVVNPQVEMNITDLTDKLKQLKLALKQACNSTETDFDYNLILGDIFMDETRLHKKCDEEYSQLKEEFERYKLRAQSVLKNKTSKDAGGSKEMEDLKNSLVELKERYSLLAEKYQSECQRYQATIDDLRMSITHLHASHKQELSSMQSDCQQKVAEIESRLHQHRDRTISLLAEKDKEIELLQCRSRRADSEFVLQPPKSFSLSDEAIGADSAQPTAESPVDEIFAHGGTGPLLHYTEEVARTNNEISSLRRQKRGLEMALQELQLSSSSKQEQYEEQIAVLKAEVQRLDRNQSREGVNLEYLKNVIYQYMVATDSVGQQAIFNAIATILHFSPKEKKAVMDSWKTYSYLPSMSSKR